MAEEISGTPVIGSYSQTPAAGGGTANQVLKPGKGNIDQAAKVRDGSAKEPIGAMPEGGPDKNSFPSAHSNLGKNGKGRFGPQDSKVRGSGPDFGSRTN